MAIALFTFDNPPSKERVVALAWEMISIRKIPDAKKQFPLHFGVANSQFVQELVGLGLDYESSLDIANQIDSLYMTFGTKEVIRDFIVTSLNRRNN